MYCSGLKVGKKTNYNALTNAAGDTVVDYINSKRVISVTIIPLEDEIMQRLQADIGNFAVTLSFRNPTNGELEDIEAIIPDSEVEYYTIRVDNVSYKALNLTFTEL